MSREIKFRAWDKERSEMYEVDALHFHRQLIEVDSETDHQTTSIEPYELMQYTGLKDINDVEIYEGDIVKHLDGISGAEHVNEVYWRKGSLVFNVIYEKDVVYTVPIHSIHMDDNRGYLQSLEVIGNIYEHPELLK